ncbi:TolC family protein [Flavobacteriaceae bacterium]|nr:TolC family protein [Flavobacteriaceae bacterium]
MKKIYFIIMISYNLTYSQVEKLDFSLEEAINFAQLNNTTLKSADLQIKAAEAIKWETISTGLPKINASINYSNWIKQQVSLIPAAAFDNTQSIIDVVNNYFDVDQTNNNVSQAEGLIPLKFGTKQSLNGNVSLSQLVFDGTYFVGLKSVQIYVDIEQGIRNKTSIELRKSTIESYGNVLLAKESVNIIKKNIKIVENTLNEVIKIYENGLTEEENIEQLQITLSGLQSNLKNGLLQEKLASQLLNLILGLEIDQEINLTENFENLIDKNINLSVISKNSNIKKSADYIIKNNDKTSKELLVFYEKTKLLPTINAFINAGYSGYSDNFDFKDKSQKWYGSTIFGLKMDIPILSSGEQLSKITRAKIELEKSTLQLSELEKKLNIEINLAKGNYQFAIEDYYNKKRSLELSERIERKNQIKFTEGIASSFDLRDAQTQLYKTQQSYLMSMLSIINSKAKLESLTSENNQN